MERVLVIDPDPHSRLVMEVGLIGAGIPVETAADTRQAREKLKDVGVVISEADLPGEEPFEFARRLKTEFRGISLLLITRRDGVEDKITGLETGADEYLTKPIYLREFVARVHACLKKRELATLGASGPTRRYQGLLSENLIHDILLAALEGGRSGQIQLASEGLAGRLTFSGGELRQAECGMESGAGAAVRLLLVDTGSFNLSFQAVDQSAAPSMTSTMDIALSLRRHWERLTRDHPSLAAMSLQALLAREGKNPIARLAESFRAAVAAGCPDPDLPMGLEQELTPAPEGKDDSGAVTEKPTAAADSDWFVVEELPVVASAPKPPKEVPAAASPRVIPPVAATAPVPPLLEEEPERVRLKIAHGTRRAERPQPNAIQIKRSEPRRVRQMWMVFLLAGALALMAAAWYITERQRYEVDSSDQGARTVTADNADRAEPEPEVKSAPPAPEPVAAAPVAPETPPPAAPVAVAEVVPEPAPDLGPSAPPVPAPVAAPAAPPPSAPVTIGVPAPAAPAPAAAPSVAVAPALEPAPAKKPPSPALLEQLARGREALRQWKLEEAEAAFLEAEKLDAGHPSVQAGLGEVCLNRGDLNGAAARFAEAVRLDAAQIRVWLQLGTVYQSLGRNAEARQAYERYLELDPYSDTSRDVKEILKQL